jgi:hypothetical protein
VRLDWLETPAGAKVVGIGLCAVIICLALFTVQDIEILFTGNLGKWHWFSGVWRLLWAAVASLFSALTVFFWRRLIPRIAMALFSASMASHVFEQFIALPMQHLKLIALCRVFVSLGVIGLYLHYRSIAPKAGINS